jgi:hypothetical protein
VIARRIVLVAAQTRVVTRAYVVIRLVEILVIDILSAAAVERSVAIALIEGGCRILRKRLSTP